MKNRQTISMKKNILFRTFLKIKETVSVIISNNSLLSRKIDSQGYM